MEGAALLAMVVLAFTSLAYISVPPRPGQRLIDLLPMNGDI